MALLELQGGGRFLSEALPLQFPDAGISETESILWEMYYLNKKGE